MVNKERGAKCRVFEVPNDEWSIHNVVHVSDYYGTNVLRVVSNRYDSQSKIPCKIIATWECGYCNTKNNIEVQGKIEYNTIQFYYPYCLSCNVVQQLDKEQACYAGFNNHVKNIVLEIYWVCPNCNKENMYKIKLKRDEMFAYICRITCLHCGILYEDPDDADALGGFVGNA